MTNTTSAAIRVGIGGWTFEPWRGVFYPDGLRQADELAFAASQLTAIEINATYYRLQTPASFAKWRDATPDGFRFAIKASRYCTNRKVLGQAGESITKFMAQGLGELGDRLGPIMWQLAPTKIFDPDDMKAFFDLLPAKLEGARLHHAIEVRHASFACPEFVALARTHGVAIVLADHETYPQIADPTADFVYARLMRSRDEVATGYPREALDTWTNVARDWSSGKTPEGLRYVSETPAADRPASHRDVFAFFISGAKVRAPAAAMALIERLKA